MHSLRCHSQFVGLIPIRKFFTHLTNGCNKIALRLRGLKEAKLLSVPMSYGRI